MGDLHGSKNKLGIHTVSAAGILGYATSSHRVKWAARPGAFMIRLRFTGYKLNHGTKKSLCQGML